MLSPFLGLTKKKKKSKNKKEEKEEDRLKNRKGNLGKSQGK